jgi:HTH-type transcriptional regulator/antitoxin HigA
MEILASLDEDIPLSPMAAVEPRKDYAAFLQAEEVLAATPKQSQGAAEHQLSELTSHFYAAGKGSVTLYRKRNDASAALIEIWLSAVRQMASWYVVANAVPPFTGIDAQLLQDLPRRFNHVNDLPKIGPWLAERGIVLVYESSLPGIKLDGAVFKSLSGQIIIGLSLRYARLDYLWFTLLHELAHVVLHADQLESPILDDLDSHSDELVERQADRLASDSLIPRNEWRSCPARYSNSVDDIVSFAKKIGIAPQCVAGRLRRELGRYDLFSEIVNKYDIREIVNGDKK